MKTLKILTALALLFVFGCVLYWVVEANFEATRQAKMQGLKPQPRTDVAQAPAVSTQDAIVLEPDPSMVSEATPPSPASRTVSGALSQAAPEKPATPQKASKKEWQDPEARFALFFVGELPEAEEYWYSAINDPNLPPNERQDLIEDLNEEGFADPKNLTPDDLPLILSRMELIEELAADAMDKVNADAFQEAYKDLVNMAARAAR